MRKLFLATPAFSGQVQVPYAIALAETMTYLAMHGIQMMPRIHTSGSLLVRERNDLNKAFLQTDCTHMLCVDSDLGWPPQAVKGLLEYDEDFVCGLYPSRKGTEFIFRPVKNEDGSIKRHEKKPILLEMEYVPAGFMMIKRNVIEKMHQHFAHLYYKPKAESLAEYDGHLLFNTELMDGEFWGEDYVFCRRVREAGFKIYVDPMIQFNHHGVIGSFSELLTPEKPNEPITGSK